jgi:hypothetical protein
MAAGEFTVTAAIGCPAPSNRQVDWSVWSHVDTPATIVSALLPSGVGVSGLTPGVTIPPGVGMGGTSFHFGEFGPVTLTVKLSWNSGGAKQTVTVTGTANLTPTNCSSVPSARLESRCDGWMRVYVSNAPEAGRATQFGIYAPYAPDVSLPYFSGVVEPGTSTWIGVPPDKASHVTVVLDMTRPWIEGFWQQAGCVGPAASPSQTGGGTGGSGSSGGGSGGGGSGGGATADASPSPPAESVSPSVSATGSPSATPTSATPRPAVTDASPVSAGVDTAWTGAALGGALGGVALFGLAAAGFWWWRRRADDPPSPLA